MRAHLLTIALLVSALLSGEVSAEEIYKWTDADGNVHYSTRPEHPNAEEADLPPVHKEDLDQKIKQIRAETPRNCEAHGGEDCTKGPDGDGSVICFDGYRDAVLPFRFHCMEVRLQSDLAALFSSPPAVVKVNKLEGERRSISGLQVSVRNLSAVPAFGVQVEVEVPGRRKHRFEAVGPDKVEPFGLADYTAAIDPRASGISVQELSRARARVRCTNCSAVLKNKR